MKTSRVAVADRERRILLDVFVCVFLSQTAIALIVPLLPIHLRENLEADMFLVGAVVAFFALFETATRVPFGILSDRWGRIRVASAGALLCAAGYLLMSRLSEALFFVPARLFDGMGVAALFPSFLALLGDWIPEERRGQAMNAVVLAYLLAFGTGPVLGLFLLHRTGSFLPLFYLACFFMLCCMLLANVRLPAKPREAAQAPSGAYRPSPYLPTAFFLLFGVGLLAPVLPVFVREQLMLSFGEMAGLVVILGLLAVSVSLLAGRVADRKGKDKTFALGTILLATSCLAVPLTFHLLYFFLLGVLALAGVLFAVPSYLALAAQAEDHHRGRQLGWFGLLQGIGFGGGAAMGGKTYEMVWSLPFVISGLAFFAAYLLSRRVRR